MLAWLLTQAAPTVDPSPWQQFGPYAVTVAILVAVIGWLLKRLAASEKAREVLVDRLLAQSEKSIPLLERTASALERRERDR